MRHRTSFGAHARRRLFALLLVRRRRRSFVAAIRVHYISMTSVWVPVRAILSVQLRVNSRRSTIFSSSSSDIFLRPDDDVSTFFSVLGANHHRLLSSLSPSSPVILLGRLASHNSTSDTPPASLNASSPPETEQYARIRPGRANIAIFLIVVPQKDFLFPRRRKSFGYYK